MTNKHATVARGYRPASSHDRPTRAIAEFAGSVRYSDLDSAVVDAVVRQHLDSIGHALAGVNAQPCVTARAAAGAAIASPGCTVIGSRDTCAPEQAAFANATMIGQPGSQAAGRHDSNRAEFIAAVHAAAEIAGADGRAVVSAIYIGHELLNSLGRAYLQALGNGPDVGAVSVGIASAMAAGLLLGLTQSQLENAVAIAVVPGVVLAAPASRTGEVSYSAAAFAAMTGLFAARIAAAGMTGPEAPFEGEDGFHRWAPPAGSLTIGHRTDPGSGTASPSDDQLRLKFRQGASGSLDDSSAAELEELLWNLPRLPDTTAMARCLRATRREDDEGKSEIDASA